MELLPDLSGDMTTHREVEHAAAALAERFQADPADEDCRRAISTLRVQCGRYGYRRPKALPEVRPSAEAVADGLGLTDALRAAGLCVIYPEEREALEAAWQDMASRRLGLDLHGRRGFAELAAPPWPLRYRLLERLEDGGWKPLHLICEKRRLVGVKSTGFLRVFPVDAWRLEDLEIEDFPVDGDSVCRMSPIRKAPPGTDPQELLEDLREQHEPDPKC